MEYLSDKFSLKSQAIKGSDYYMDQVMETLDNVPYYNKTSPKCVQAFSMQSNDQHSTMDRSSPCDNQNSKSGFENFSPQRCKCRLTKHFVKYLKILQWSFATPWFSEEVAVWFSKWSP